MPSPFRRSLPIAGAAAVVTTALTLAATPASVAPHVRPETTEASGLLNELTARSATARALVDDLNQSDVVVYIRHRTFTESTLVGRIGLLQSQKPTRNLIVELASGRSRLEQLAALGHELQHAVEIAAAHGVVNPATLASHYRHIGTATESRANVETFETEAAQDASARIRRELLERSARTTHDRH